MRDLEISVYTVTGFCWNIKVDVLTIVAEHVADTKGFNYKSIKASVNLILRVRTGL